MSESTPRRARGRRAGGGGEEAEEAPKTAFLPPQGQWINSLEDHYIIKQNEAAVAAGREEPFPTTTCAAVGKGSLIYVTFATGGGEEAEEEGEDGEAEGAGKVQSNCYLGECASSSPEDECIWVHFTDARLLTGASDDRYTEKLMYTEEVYMVRDAGEGSLERKGAEGGEEAGPLKKAKEIVKKHDTMAKGGSKPHGGIDWDRRLEMIAKAVVRVWGGLEPGKHAALTQKQKAGEGVVVEDSDPLTLLVRDALRKEQQRIADVTQTTANVKMLGMPDKNASIVLWAVARMPPAAAPNHVSGGGGAWAVELMERMEERLNESAREQKKQLESFMGRLVGATRAMTGKGPEAVMVGGAADNPGKGDCAYHVCGAVKQLVEDPDPDNVKYSAAHVARAKEEIIANAIKLKEMAFTRLVADGLGAAEAAKKADEEMMALLAEPTGAFITRVTSGKGPDAWGGFEAFLLASRDSVVRVVVVDAREFGRAGGQTENGKAVYRVQCPGEQDKTHVIYVIWTGSHYKLGITKAGEVKKAVFEVGKEADDACEKITAFLKTQASVASCLSASGDKRTEEIRKLVKTGGKIQAVKLGKKGVSFAEAVSTGSGQPAAHDSQPWQQAGGKRNRRHQGMGSEQGERAGGYTRREPGRSQARQRSPSPSPRPRPRRAGAGGRALTTNRVPVLVVRTGAAPGDFLSDLARRNLAIRRLVSGATIARGQAGQLILFAFRDNEAALKESRKRLESEGLVVRDFEERRGGSGAEGPKKLLCEYVWKGEKCPRGAKCSKHHYAAQ